MKRSKPHKFVVINADDLGLCKSTNDAIFKAYKKGILTSASLLVTCPGFKDAVLKCKKNKGLGVGIHLSLTLGKSVLTHKKIPDLVNRDGLFYPGYTRLLIGRKKDLKHEIFMELDAQIQKAIKHGIKLDHIDSQEHVHMVPYIYKITLELAEKYKIPFVRLSKDKIITTTRASLNIKPLINKNIIKYILLNSLAVWNNRNRKSVPARFFGVYHTGHMAKPVFKAIIKDISPGVTEILSHPGYSTNDTNFNFKAQKMYNFMTHENRKKELEVLLDEDLKKEFEKNSIILTNYTKLRKL